jgi:hypothetical protein
VHLYIYIYIQQGEDSQSRIARQDSQDRMQEEAARKGLSVQGC